MKYPWCAIYAFTASLGLVVSPAFAGSFDVSPVRITLDTQRPIAAITLQNRAAEASVIQVEVLRWERSEGQDVYHPSRELIVNPPVFTVEAGRRQIVRIGLNRAADKTRELAYRIYLQEVLPPPAPGFRGLRMALRIGLPVFVMPESEAKPLLRYEVTRLSDGTFRVAATNDGNAHVRIEEVRLMAPAEGGRVMIAAHPVHIYLFPGESAEWLLTPTVDWHGSLNDLLVLTDQGTTSTDIDVK